jgi:hypothetical protein
MFIYVGKRFDAAKVGGFVVGVVCDKCRCEYYYELTRRGTGAGEAPYGIGTTRAAESAQAQAERDLKIRLASEADLVPCPKCHWINDELIQGYRLGQYRGCGVLAFVVGLLGTIAALLCALYLWMGTPRDHGAIPYFLIGGPTLFAMLAGGIILLRNGLRRLIRPNRNFPRPPAVPVGSARALLLDSNGQLGLADPLDVSDGVDFAVDRFQLPPLCCGCLQAPDQGYAYKLPLGQASHLEIPRCGKCARQAKRKYLQLWLLYTVCGWVVGGGLLLLFDWLGWLTLEILVGFGLLTHLIFAFMFAASLAAPVKFVVGDRPAGIVRLRFRNSDYARVVAKQIADRSATSAPMDAENSAIAQPNALPGSRYLRRDP